MITKNSRILITGGTGLVGSALTEELKSQGYHDLVILTREQCDLTNLESVKTFFLGAKPDVVFHAAAAVFGIGGNLKNPGAIFLANILINTHVVEASRLANVKKVVAMGSIAAYPSPKVTPVSEKYIWEGPPHESEGSYGHAKRAMLAQLIAYHSNFGLDYAYAISTNLFGAHDKFNIEHGHVIPSLIRKFYEAKKAGTGVEIWGDGSASRDFLYAKDMARALVLLMNCYTGAINIASGNQIMITEVVKILSDYYGMQNQVKWNPKMPNGRKYYEIDLARLKSLGFQPNYTMETGLKETLDWFQANCEQFIRH